MAYTVTSDALSSSISSDRVSVLRVSPPSVYNSMIVRPS